MLNIIIENNFITNISMPFHVDVKYRNQNSEIKSFNSILFFYSIFFKKGRGKKGLKKIMKINEHYLIKKIQIMLTQYIF